MRNERTNAAANRRGASSETEVSLIAVSTKGRAQRFGAKTSSPYFAPFSKVARDWCIFFKFVLFICPIYFELLRPSSDLDRQSRRITLRFLVVEKWARASELHESNTVEGVTKTTKGAPVRVHFDWASVRLDKRRPSVPLCSRCCFERRGRSSRNARSFSSSFYIFLGLDHPKRRIRSTKSSRDCSRRHKSKRMTENHSNVAISVVIRDQFAAGDFDRARSGEAEVVE